MLQTAQRVSLWENWGDDEEAVTKVIDTLTQEKLLEWHNKCITAGEDYFEWD